MTMVTIEDKGCRGCSLCVDKCPVSVFEAQLHPRGGQTAQVVRSEDCVGCFACYHLCPSQCIEISDVVLQRPFYRVGENVNFVDRFLQAGTNTGSLQSADWEEAYRDVSTTLVALADAIVENVGRAVSAVGFQAGKVAASHFPEIYEEPDLDGVLGRLRERFQDCFSFQYKLDGDDIQFTFNNCVLNQIVEQETRDRVGDALLCRLFHDYLAGLAGAYSGSRYRYKVAEAGARCEVRYSMFRSR
jgi:NAD-dependent dihydropyrimidine dehydrogenase PreA subunit